MRNKRARLIRATRSPRTFETREAVRHAASERDNQLDALAAEYVPRLRELHDEYTARRHAVHVDYEQKRLSIVGPQRVAAG